MLNIRINRKGVKILRFKASQKAAFGFGAFGKDVVYMLVATYLLYYCVRWNSYDGSQNI